MFTGRGFMASVVGPGLVLLMVAACGSTSAPTASLSPSVEPRLVVQDYANGETRVVRLDGTDIATIKGRFDGIVAGRVVVVNGTTIETIDRAGTVKTLGQLVADPALNASGTVLVSPDLSQWIYTIAVANWTSDVHLGTASGDRVVASVPSPDGFTFYAPFVWNASGIYMVKSGTGLGGVGPFLEYHFPLARLDLIGGRITDISPSCIAYAVFGDGTMLCRTSNTSGAIEVRSPSGATHAIQLTANSIAMFAAMSMSANGRRLAVDRDGDAAGSAVNYQIAVADISASTATPFGPLDYVPDTWLPDGRLVADHRCIDGLLGGGPCDSSLDGTYVFSSDGASHSLLFKLISSGVVGYL